MDLCCRSKITTFWVLIINLAFSTAAHAATLTLAAEIDLPSFGGYSAIEYKDGYLFGTDDDGDSYEFGIWNLSDPSNPVEVSSTVMNRRLRPEDMILSGNTLFISSSGTNNDFNMDVFDVTDPVNPVLISSYVNFSWNGSDVEIGDLLAVSATELVATSGVFDIARLDISDLNNIAIIGGYGDRFGQSLFNGLGSFRFTGLNGGWVDNNDIRFLTFSGDGTVSAGSKTNLTGELYDFVVFSDGQQGFSISWTSGPLWFASLDLSNSQSVVETNTLDVSDLIGAGFSARATAIEARNLVFVGGVSNFIMVDVTEANNPIASASFSGGGDYIKTFDDLVIVDGFADDVLVYQLDGGSSAGGSASGSVAQSATQFLQTTSSSNNVTTLHLVNSSASSQSFTGTLYNQDGDQLGSADQSLGSSIEPKGRQLLSSSELESIFGVAAWSGPAMLEVSGSATFELMAKLVSPSGLVSNTNCVRQDRVLNIEGFDSDNKTFVRFINTTSESMGAITGTLYDTDGNVIGNQNFTLTSSLVPKEQIWINRDNFASKAGAQWTGAAMLEVEQVIGLKLLNLNFINNETFFNFSCFEDSSSGSAYLQTTSTSANISFTHLVNTSDSAQQFTGTLYNSAGEQLGSANQALHTGTIAAKGRVVLSSEELETAFEISPWSGPAILDVSGSDSFELLTKLTSPSGLISNTNCVRQNQVHNIEGFDSEDMTFVRFINIGTTTLTNIKGTLYDASGGVIGSSNQILVDSLPAKAAVWVNRNTLSDIVSDTWNGEAMLAIDSAPDTLRLLNLNFINSETFFNFSCYESAN